MQETMEDKEDNKEGEQGAIIKRNWRALPDTVESGVVFQQGLRTS
jgi:hypothetical protein